MTTTIIAAAIATLSIIGAMYAGWRSIQKDLTMHHNRLRELERKEVARQLRELNEMDKEERYLG